MNKLGQQTNILIYIIIRGAHHHILRKEKMGACMSALGAPSVEYPAQEVSAEIEDILKELPAEVANAKTELKSNYNEAKAKGEDYTVLGGKDGDAVLKVLKKDLEEEQLKKEIDSTVGLIIGKGKFASTAASKVWEKVEAKLDEKKPNLKDNCLMTADDMWSKIKSPIQDKVEEEVASKIEAAVDELLKKQQAAEEPKKEEPKEEPKAEEPKAEEPKATEEPKAEEPAQEASA